MTNRELLAALRAIGCFPVRPVGGGGSHQMWAAPNGARFSLIVTPHRDATKQLGGVVRWLREAGIHWRPARRARQEQER